MAEAITKGNLASHMTSHGLGTGFYGFINEANARASGYLKLDSTKSHHKEFTIYNPLELGKVLQLDNSGNILGEVRDDIIYDNLGNKINTTNGILVFDNEVNQYIKMQDEVVDEIKVIEEGNGLDFYYEVNLSGEKFSEGIKLKFDSRGKLLDDPPGNIKAYLGQTLKTNEDNTLRYEFYIVTNILVTGDRSAGDRRAKLYDGSPVYLGEKKTDLQIFTNLSTGLNYLCNTFYNEFYKDLIYDVIISEEHINEIKIHIDEHINKNKILEYLLLEPNIPFNWENHESEQVFLTSSIRVEIATLLNTIKAFLFDYIILTENDYIMMPINYLLIYLGYDGIYNLNGDIGSLGSVKYLFKFLENGDIIISPDYARGYTTNEKTSPPKQGNLILMGKKFPISKGIDYVL